MSREQRIRIAMVVCAVIVICAVIAASTGMFSASGIEGYADADKYTAGATEITEEIKNLDINWTRGRVIIAYHAEHTITLDETTGRSLAEDEKLQWRVDGKTLHVQLSRPGTHRIMPEKTLIITLPEGISFEKASIQTTSADVEIPALKAQILELGSTSGDIHAAAEADRVAAGSTSGDLEIRLTGETNSISAGSTSGSISIEAGRVKHIEANTTSGGIGITADENKETTAGSTSGSIYVTLRKMEKLSISATSGNVAAALPADPGFTATVEMTSGQLSYDLAMTNDGGKYICGDGSGKVSIGTTSGDIRIESVGEK